MISEEIKTAYLETSYRVYAPAGTITLRIGESSAALDRLLVEHGSDFWAFITAFNPRSKPLGAETNEVRHLELIERVRGYKTFEGESQADDLKWPAEKSLLIIGIEPEVAVETGKHFNQNAIVIGRLNESPQLLFLL